MVALLTVLFGICPEAKWARADESGAGFQVVAHPDNPTDRVARRLLASLFLKEVTRWGSGEAVRPVDLKSDAPARRHFSERVLNRSVGAVKSYWQQRIFAGRGVPPPELDSDSEVIRHVMKHPGGIGYVSSTADIGKARLIRFE
jgi:hypothetical protein